MERLVSPTSPFHYVLSLPHFIITSNPIYVCIYIVDGSFALFSSHGGGAYRQTATWLLFMVHIYRVIGFGFTDSFTLSRCWGRAVRLKSCVRAEIRRQTHYATLCTGSPRRRSIGNPSFNCTFMQNECARFLAKSIGVDHGLIVVVLPKWKEEEEEEEGDGY